MGQNKVTKNCFNAKSYNNNINTFYQTLYMLAFSDWTERCSVYAVTSLLHHRRRGRTEPISSRYTTELEEPQRLNNTFHLSVTTLR